MALSGVHIVFSVVASGSKDNAGLLPCQLGSSSSQMMGSAGTSAISASRPGVRGQAPPLLSITASAPIFYAVGPSPDATGVNTSRRYMDPQFGREDIFVSPGDRFAWEFA